MNGTLQVLRLGGVPVRLHWSFFLALPYFTWAMYHRMTAAGGPGATGVLPPLLWGFLLAVLFFVCILLHELGHVRVARAHGAGVRDINLMLLGGVSRIEGLGQTGSAEATMALAGPLVSLALAVLTYLPYRLFPSAAADARFALLQLAEMNLAVGVFNLLPAFPLDGGRVLRALLAERQGLSRATRTAATVGRVFAGVLLVLGLLAGQLLLPLIAVFLWTAAGAEADAVRAREMLAGLTVADAANWSAPDVTADATLEQVAEVMMRARADSVLVHRADGAYGVLDVATVGRMPRERRAQVEAGELARFVGLTAEASAGLSETLEQMAFAGLDAVPVRSQGRVVGVLAREDIARRLRLKAMVEAGA